MANKDFNVRHGLTVANSVLVTNATNVGIGNNIPLDTLRVEGTASVNSFLIASDSGTVNAIANSSGIYHTGTINSLSFNTTTANVTSINATSITTTSINATSVNATTFTTGGTGTGTGGLSGSNTKISIGNSSVNSLMTSAGLNVNGTSIVNSSGLYTSTVSANNFGAINGTSLAVTTSINASSINATSINAFSYRTGNTIDTTTGTGAFVANVTHVFVGNNLTNSVLTSAGLTVNGATVANNTGVYTGIVNATSINSTSINALSIISTSINSVSVNTTSINATSINATSINATSVNAFSYRTGTTTDTTTGAGALVANVTHVFVGNNLTNSVLTSAGLIVNGATVANNTGVYTGIVNATLINAFSYRTGTTTDTTTGTGALVANVTHVFIGNNTSNTIVTANGLTVNDATIANTSGVYTGIVNATSINATSINATSINSFSYRTGTVTTTTTGTGAVVANVTHVFVGNNLTNTILTSAGLTVNGSTIANNSGVYANTVNAVTLSVGTASVINSTVITTTGYINSSSLNVTGMANVGGTLRVVGDLIITGNTISAGNSVSNADFLPTANGFNLGNTIARWNLIGADVSLTGAINAATFGVFSANVSVGANVSVDTEKVKIGSTSQNSIFNSSGITIVNSSSTSNLNPNYFYLSSGSNTTTVNSSSIIISPNTTYNSLSVTLSDGVSVGNTTQNSVIKQTAFSVSNTIGNTSVTPRDITIQTSSDATTFIVNSTSLSISNSVATSNSIAFSRTRFALGNATVNAVITSNSFTSVNGGYLALGTINSTAQGLTANVTTVILGNATVNTVITSNSFVSANGGYFALGTINATSNGLIANSTTLQIGNALVNSSINSTSFSGTSNNALSLGGTLAASYVQNTDSRTLSGNLVFSGNTTFLGTNVSVASNAFFTGTNLNVGSNVSVTGTNLNVASNVSITGSLVTNNVTINGNLTVSGTTTYVNSVTLNIGDNIITLNADVASNLAPSENAGIEINRGSSANVFLRWNETTDLWEFTKDGTTYFEVGDILDVTAGSGLTGGGTSGSVTVDVGAGNGISVSADAVAAKAANGISVDTSGINILGNTGLVVNTSGIFVNATYINTISSNNSSYLGGLISTGYQTTAGLAGNVAILTANNANNLGTFAATSYLRTSGDYTITGIRTYQANLILSTTAALIANGGSGTSGQLLTSNGSTVYWANAPATTNTSGGTGALQYYNGSGFGSSSNLIFDGTTLKVSSGTLGTTLGNQLTYTTFSSLDTNGDLLEITNTRTANGSDWTSAGTRLQQKVDSTWMGYLQFNGNNSGGISFGTGTSTTSGTSIPEIMRIDSTGKVGIGTTSPSYKLDVFGTARFYSGLSLSLNAPSTPTLSASTGGGSLIAATYYFKIVAVDAFGFQTSPSSESNVTTSGPTSSIAVSWTAVSGALSYQIWFSTSSGTQSTYFTSTSNSYSFTTTSGSSSSTIPSVNNTGRFGINSSSPRGALDISLSSGQGYLVVGTSNISYPTNPTSYGITVKGSTSDARLMVQDGQGRLNDYWNAYTDAAGFRYIVANEPANRFQKSVSTTANGAVFGFYSAPSGISAGDLLTWTQIASIGGNSSIWFSGRGTSTDFNITTGGNVGIGTTPTSKLEVLGDGSILGRAGSSTGYFDIIAGRFDFSSTPSYSGTVLRKYGESATGTEITGINKANLGALIFQNGPGLIYTNGSDALNLATASATRMTITSSGTVGIGTTGPENTLDVAGGISNRGGSQTSTGWVRMQRGDGTHHGYLEFLRPDGTRDSYIGYGTSGTASLWTSGTFNITSPSGTSVSGPITGSSTISDSKGNVRSIPRTPVSSAYQLAATDAGKVVSITTGGITVPASTFSIGDAISIYNNSAASQSITTSAVTCYLAGTATTGTRTLAQYGIATLLCVDTNIFVISGAGLT